MKLNKKDKLNLLVLTKIELNRLRKLIKNEELSDLRDYYDKEILSTMAIKNKLEMGLK